MTPTANFDLSVHCHQKAAKKDVLSSKKILFVLDYQKMSYVTGFLFWSSQ